MTENLPAKSGSFLPTLEGASAEIQARMTEVRDNLESIETFRLPRVKMTATGAELIEGEPPLTELVGTIIHTKKTNIYYKNPFNPKELAAPDCFSLDGEMPDKTVKEPVHKTCKGCPMAEFGTNSMKSGKACRNMKPLYLLLGDEAIMPRQLSVAPSSLKAANQYLMDLTERGLSYRKVKTKITLYKKDAADTYMSLKFSLASKLDEQGAKNTEALRNFWLPVMNNQTVDHSELATDGSKAPEPVPTGEY